MRGTALLGGSLHRTLAYDTATDQYRITPGPGKRSRTSLIGDVANPRWRARSVGVYRLWRDGGYAVGALMAGLLADALGIPISNVPG